jgi:hypothetical protein
MSDSAVPPVVGMGTAAAALPKRVWNAAVGVAAPSQSRELAPAMTDW